MDNYSESPFSLWKFYSKFIFGDEEGYYSKKLGASLSDRPSSYFLPLFILWKVNFSLFSSKMGIITFILVRIDEVLSAER